MAYKVAITHFEGPLDLLLQLIEKKELDISNIALAEVTEQYLEHMESAEERHPHELADFLDVASRLIYIKSRALLPFLEPDEEEGPPLDEQLKLYRDYFEAAQKLEAIIAKRPFLYSRERLVSVTPVFQAPEGLKSFDLQRAMEDVLDHLEPVIRIPQTVMKRTISLQERMCQIQDKLEQTVKTSFKKITKSGSRMDVVISFLAILELVKKQFICARQPKTFQDIEIEKQSS
jgi:segregation and condensation protein A